MATPQSNILKQRVNEFKKDIDNRKKGRDQYYKDKNSKLVTSPRVK